jgi:hypothetical protein
MAILFVSIPFSTTFFKEILMNRFLLASVQWKLLFLNTAASLALLFFVVMSLDMVILPVLIEVSRKLVLVDWGAIAKFVVVGSLLMYALLLLYADVVRRYKHMMLINH